MIHYQLRCGDDHEFDAWFRDSAAYEEQAGNGLLKCPHCGERQVMRALMAPALYRQSSRTHPASDSCASVESTSPVHVPAPPERGIPDYFRAILQRVRAEVERRCEYVGESFAAEARRIHGGESKARGIYGEATAEEAEALTEDGIEVGRIPWLPRADA